MNDLSLRVTAIKLCSHPKRFAELRDALVPVPNKWKASPHSFVQQFATASSSAEQVNVIRTLFHGSHVQQPQEEEHEQEKGKEDRRLAVEQFLASVLLASPLKHSVRNQLIKLFSDQALAKQVGQPQHTKPQLVAALREALREMAGTVSATEPPQPLTHDQVNDVFVSANACLQNFAYGREALGHELHSFLPLLSMALERYWLDISNSAVLELSPTRLNELYLFVQNVLRFHVGVLSEWGAQLAGGASLLLVQVVAEKVARHSDTPWDVRSIAGLVIGKNTRFFDRFEDYLDKWSKAMPIEYLPIQAAALNVLLPEDYQRYGSRAADIVDRLMDLTAQEGSANNVLVYMAKHFHGYSKSLGAPVAHLSAGPQRQGYERILYAMQRFALANICSATDSVRHMCGGIFMQILQHGQACGLAGLFEEVYVRFEDGGSLAAGCLAVEKLVGVQGAREAIRHCPSLFGSVFPKYLGVDDAVDSLFRAMMVASRKEQSFEDWREQWLDLLLEAPRQQEAALSHRGADHTGRQKEPQTLRHIWLQPDTSVPFKHNLTAILSARNEESSQLPQVLLLEQLQRLREALVWLDDHLRLLTLRFVGAAARPSEPVSAEERAIIGFYLKHNINNPSAHIRQLGFGHMLKVVRRIELCLAEHRKRPSATGADQMAYLRSLMALLADNLFHSANYGRRWLSLRLLQSCTLLCSRLDIPMGDILTASQAERVEACLWDSYEHNKLLAAQLLIKLQPCSRIVPDRVMELLQSLRPPDSLTGAYLLQVHCQAQQVETQLVPAVPPPLSLPEGGVRYQPRIYAALQWCLQPLREALALATTNLAEGAKLSPMYGLLLASRHLVELLAMEELAREPLWRRYVQELVDVCMAISEVVLPVVSSVAPEGYLPEASDQETDQQVTNVLRRRLDAEALRQIQTTPQMVLLCAWRSIKEVSNILGGLVERSPLEQEQAEKDDHTYLLSGSQLTAIGDHFLLLLAEIKHRGAFEQAYVGFSMLCRRFWHSDAAALNQLPAAWVNEALDMIQGEQQQQQQHHHHQSRLCPTRRSAGIPYMLQALVCSELKLGTHNTLHRCMNRLLKVCETPRGDSAAGAAGGAARCHALNIMRALFRSSELADLVGEFVARGIICTLDGLLATDWAEQNSASLLLATLVVRVFGVERPRDDAGELHVRNRMTGRIFFTRYPELYNYFSKGLAKAALGPRALNGVQKIHLQSMLMLLSRLYPSSLEGAESTLKLSNFVPDLLKISLCADVLTREKAAAVVGIFVDDRDAFVRMRHLLVQMMVLHGRLNAPPSPGDAFKDVPILRHNRIHGQELLMLELYRRLRWSRPNLVRMMLKTLPQVAVDLLDRSVFLFNGMLEVLVAILEDVAPGQLDEEVMVELRQVYQLTPGRIYSRCQKERLSPKIFQIFGLHLHRLDRSRGAAMSHIVEDLCKFSGPMPLPMAIEELNGELLLCVVLQDLPPLHSDLVNAGDVKVLSFSSDIVRYHKALTPDQRQELARGIASSPSVHVCLRRMYEWGQQGPPKCWSLQLAGRIGILQLLLPIDPIIDLGRLLELGLENSAAHVHFGLVLAIKRLMDRQAELSQPIWVLLLEYAQILSYATQPVYLRHKAIGLCERIGSEIGQQLCLGDVEILGRFARLVLLLLVDDDEGLRNDAAVMADQMLRQRLHPQPEPKKILANVVFTEFLRHFIASLQRYGSDSGFLLRLFNIIVEPFLLMAQETPVQEHGSLGEDGDVDLFDKQGCNLYCETLMVIREVADGFKEAFEQDTALLASIEKVLRTRVVWSRSEWD
ncbi:GL13068 [Drosophila persimilis]|uniref:GL13068 n=1 Tax=Drosophila persimilis TaxID=7234 RepID=B4GV01_DROPE|nr:GL13068 [Drosophila persimilis]